MAIIGMFFQDRVERRPRKLVNRIQDTGKLHVNRCTHRMASLAAHGAIGPITRLRPCDDAFEAGSCPHAMTQKLRKVHA